MMSDTDIEWAGKLPSTCCIFVGSLFILLIFTTWYRRKTLTHLIRECLLSIPADLHGCLFSFKYMLSIVCPSCHWSTQLPDGHGQSLIDLNWLYFISVFKYIANSVLSLSGHRSELIYKQKINNKLYWKTMLLTDATQLNQSYHRRPQVPRTCHLEPPTHPGADVSAITTEELLTAIATAGISCKWVPCSFFYHLQKRPFLFLQNKIHA